MGNVIPWSEIDPAIRSQAPFIGIVVIDPERKLCVSELVTLDSEQLSSPEAGAGELVAAAQQAAAAVASAYRTQLREQPRRLKVLRGTTA